MKMQVCLKTEKTCKLFCLQASYDCFINIYATLVCFINDYAILVMFYQHLCTSGHHCIGSPFTVKSRKKVGS